MIIIKLNGKINKLEGNSNFLLFVDYVLRKGRMSDYFCWLLLEFQRNCKCKWEWLRNGTSD